MATPLPFPLLGLTMTFLAASSATPAVEAGALVLALGIIAYLVRAEELKRRRDKHSNNGIGPTAFAEALGKALAAQLGERPCREHGEAIVGLKRDVRYLREALDRAFKAQEKRGQQ